jgi:hypothetical protein
LLPLFGLTGIPVRCVRCFVEPIVFADHSLCESCPAVYFVPTEYQQPNSAEKMEEYRKNMEQGEKQELSQKKQYVGK